MLRLEDEGEERRREAPARGHLFPLLKSVFVCLYVCGWRVELELFKTYVTLRLNYFALYQRLGTKIFKRVLRHGAVEQWRYKLALREYF